MPRSFGDLRRDASLILDMVRGELGFEYLAFFAMTPKELDDSAARASLIAESGLQLNTGRRLLELEWGKLPPEPAGARSDITRGLDAVSATINAVCVTRDTPADLKNKLTKCLFFSPVEMASHLRAAIIFGPARSGLDPNDSDYRFLARLGRAITRRYYALASEMERQWLSSRLSSEEKARKESESACRELEKTEGFTYFDARKLVDNCLERVKPALEKGGVELDSRALLERLTVRGDRPEIGAALRQILLAALDRTGAESGSKKASPVRVFLRRTRSRMIFGVEVIGDFLHPSERRRLFEEPEKVRAPQAATEGGPSAGNGSQKSEEQGSGQTPATPRASGSFSGVLATVRRHEGQFHIESERLHRFEGDPHRWMGKTTFIVELPLPSRPERQREEKEDSKSESGRIG